ncbi:hypothetical protein BM524_07275 [Alteromonas mediterranea]|uniref:PEP-CTERM sorting domain-containing protein n=1 Tax=Alteromonas mediterranea TaxID=314275 RepID=A0AAC9NRG2_9ALTE|nr:hypothetical protein [Alteromonas mediterranea]APD89611.1 hypothetical protein BM524_07275 [Alteromonas mediterranea]
MKIVRKMKFLVGSLLLLSSSMASASLITVDGFEADALQLSTTFEEFYNFDNGNTWSANTGLEQANSVVAFMAETATDTALFLIFGGLGGDAGSADFDISGTNGAVTFADDSAEMPTGTNVLFNYAADKTDGLIFSGLSDPFWSIDIVFNALSGIDSLVFYTFDQQGVSSVLFETSDTPTNLSISGAPDTSNITQVSAPMTSALMLSALGFLLFRRKR